MLTKKILFGLLVTFLACTTTLVAQDVDGAGGKKKRDPAKLTAALWMKSYQKASLTEQQQASAKAIVEKHLESYLEAKKTWGQLLTKEQIGLQKAAMKQGKADGLKGKELAAASLAATGLTEADLATYTEAKMKGASISKTVQTEILALLTDEQKAMLPAKGKGKKGKGDSEEKKKGKQKGKKKGKKKDATEESALSV